METILTSEIIKAISEGDATRFISYVAIFVFIWVEVRGLKKELKKLNVTISESFKKGEDRFETIEGRITKLEKTKGLINAESV